MTNKAWVHGETGKRQTFVSGDIHFQIDGLVHEPVDNDIEHTICGLDATDDTLMGLSIYVTCPDCGNSLVRRGKAFEITLDEAQVLEKQYKAQQKKARRK